MSPDLNAAWVEANLALQPNGAHFKSLWERGSVPTNEFLLPLWLAAEVLDEEEREYRIRAALETLRELYI